MAKFARYIAPGGEPTDVYEGDYMQRYREYVHIYKKKKPRDRKAPITHAELVAAIRLDEGHDVRKISD
jgi:hypothetical protein